MTLPVSVCACEGKGPQKERYMKMIDSLRLEHVKICTPWLEPEDYPVLLGQFETHIAILNILLINSSDGGINLA